MVGRVAAHRSMAVPESEPEPEPEPEDRMRVRSAAIAGLGAVVGVLLCCTGAHAAADDDEAPAKSGPRPLIGDVIIFNDEIVEPVSLPLSTCGGLVPLFSKAPARCEGASRVSDDDA
ncbi:hypothetical protein [Nonomuraea candida]|uniref:hypothetical protein n=1 Tax=Nonomuraea candida TaxID=359159 RepID=UPI0012FB41A7|nr:hypothetical protein [Nonomuraea candida]